MKKLATLLLAAGMMLGASTAAQAVDVKVSGQWDFNAEFGNTSFSESKQQMHGNNGHSEFRQRLRTQIDIVASEALSGTVQFEIGDTTWGKSSSAAGRGSGGSIGADGVSVEVKRAYIDYIIPQTDLKMRVGIQGIDTPSFTGIGSAVLANNAEVGGIVASYQFTPEVAVTAMWFRPYGANASNDDDLYNDRTWDDMDVFGLAIPLTFDGIKVTPWGMYAAIGRDALTSEGNYAASQANSSNTQLLPVWMDGDEARYADDGQGNAFWLGLASQLNFGTPLTIALDVNYGSVDLGTSETTGYDIKREGWLIAASAKYKLDFMTPTIFGWYGSGDDDDYMDGSEIMPAISGQSKMTSLGMDGGYGISAGAIMGESILTAGTWGIGIQLADICYMEDLKHTFTVTYYQGTNDSAMTTANGGLVSSPFMDSGSGFYLTEDDNAIEVNLTNTYDIYKNLQFCVELGYIRLDIDEDNWGSDVEGDVEDAYKIAFALRYHF